MGQEKKCIKSVSYLKPLVLLRQPGAMSPPDGRSALCQNGNSRRLKGAFAEREEFALAAGLLWAMAPQAWLHVDGTPVIGHLMRDTSVAIVRPFPSKA